MKSRLLATFFIFPLMAGLLKISPIEKSVTASITWTQIQTAHSPSARYIYGMVFDSTRNVIVLFGGANNDPNYLTDTWEYNGDEWRQLFPTQSPSGRANIDQTMVYDADRDRVVLFGGLSKTGYLNDTWEFDGFTWNKVITNQSPPGRDSHAMVYDPNRKVTVLFGGYSPSNHYLGDTWEYNGVTWRQVNPPQLPPGRYHSSMAYDNKRRVIVLFGGGTNNNTRLNDTWEYDGKTWRQARTPQSPPVRENHSIVYDSNSGGVVLFGGNGNAGMLFNDTWTYDGTTWVQMITTQSPSVRGEISLANDSQRHKTVLFGGGYWSPGLQVFDDTWELQLKNSSDNISIPKMPSWAWVGICVAIMGCGLVCIVIGVATVLYIRRRKKQ